MSSIKPVVIAASAKHTATLFFFHGLGDTGHGWASTLASIKLPHMKIVCPTAESIPVTLNGGCRMPSWFDLKSLDASGSEDESGIKKATKIVHDLIDEEVLRNGVPANRIVLGGFSMGGALALYAGLTYAKKLAGIVALSCWLPLRNEISANKHALHDIPVLQCHGDCDPVVQHKWGQMTASLLKTLISSVEFKTYSGLMHSANDEELQDMKLFFEKYLTREVSQV